ncbi:MAG: hypothetical protein WBV85_14205 [Solirubrobacteraceae bacterium]
MRSLVSLGRMRGVGVVRWSSVATVAFSSALALCGLVPATGLAEVSGALPDGRVVELVSTSGNVGEPYAPATPFRPEEFGLQDTQHPFQAAENGEAVTYVGEPAATGGTGETGPGEGNQWLAKRTPDGWSTADISQLAPEAAELTAYQAFSPDLSTNIFLGSVQPLATGVPAGCRSLYTPVAGGSEFRALFTPEVGVEGCGKPLFAGSADESQVIFQSEAALVKPAQEATEVPAGHESHSELGEESGKPCVFGCNLYDSVAGRVRLVSSLEGKPVSNATFGGYPEEPKAVTDLSNVISNDGSRIFWTDTQEGENFKHVYALEDGQNTVQVSGAGSAQYWTATPDGRYAFYTEAGELWQFDTASNTREQITAEGASVVGVIGTNQTGDDGSYVYFVAEGALAPGATPKLCVSYPAQRTKTIEEVEQGLITVKEGLAKRGLISEEEEEELDGRLPSKTGCNLYLRHEGRTSLVTILSPSDDEFSVSSISGHEGGDWKAGLGYRTAAVAPDGGHLVFESERSLTGYKNVTPAGFAIAEVFDYSAEDAHLACASCDPTGASPGLNEQEKNFTRLPVSENGETYVRRWMSDDGDRVFFDSEQSLVPGDLNGVQDVYEWEREGTGTCVAQAPPRADGGCVSLLSGANGSVPSFLVDADATGDDVFLEHEGPLGQEQVAVDRNELYDVRVGGGFPQNSLACSGTGCQGVPPAPPLFATPSSVTFAGVGNFPAPAQQSSPSSRSLTRGQKLARALKACRAKSKRKRASCERQVRRRYGVRNKSKANRSRAKGAN